MCGDQSTVYVQLCLFPQPHPHPHPPPLSSPSPPPPPPPPPPSRFLHVHHNREEDGQWGEGGVSQASLRQGVRGTPQTSFGFHVSMTLYSVILYINYYYHHYSILQTLYRQRDPHHKSVVKTRRCFLWNRQYFQLDIFTDCTDRYIYHQPETLLFHPLFGQSL